MFRRPSSRAAAALVLLSCLLASSFPAQCLAEGARPVILVPGTSRAKLADAEGKTVWGRTFNLFRFRSGGYLELPSRPWPGQEGGGLFPAGIIEKFAFFPFLLELDVYGSFLEKMERSGYTRGQIDLPRQGDDFFVFDYDWRLDAAHNARLLAERIGRLRRFYGDPGMKFDFIAHSSAYGLVRYYALYGGRDVLDEENPVPDYGGADAVARLIELAPVRKGTLYAFKVLHEGFRPAPLPFLFKYPARSAFSAPAFFQMLPPRTERIFVDREGRPAQADLYEAMNWKKYGWSVFSHEEIKAREKRLRSQDPHNWRARAAEEDRVLTLHLEKMLRRADVYHHAVDSLKHPLPAGIEVHSLVPEWGETLACLELPGAGGMFEMKHSRDCTAPGDGMITLASMEDPASPSRRFRQKHRRIAADERIQETILDILRKSFSA